MMFKTVTSVAFAAACLAAAATSPVQAQTAGGYGNSGPQTHQGNPNWSGDTSGGPGWSAGASGSTAGSYARQSHRGNMAPPAAGTGGTEMVTNGPQATPGDNSSSWSARRNVTESRQYDRLLETNRGFREARMRKECGPITDPQLRQDCLASFRQDEPAMGSSTSHSGDHSEYGR